MFNTPVLLLIFNRPETTVAVFEQIKQLQPKYLFVAADGARKAKEGEAALCEAARKIVLQGIDWPCEVATLFRDENIGCKNAVSQAIKWFFTTVEQGIILEDDCVPDESFFYFCEELLEKYKDDSTVISIGGTNLGYTFTTDQSYGFSRVMNFWGWATWKRSIKLVDYDMELWKNIRFKNWFLHKRLNKKSGVDLNWVKYWREYFDLTSVGLINTWDYQWIFAQLYYKNISIFPAKNLIKNIGFADNATHTNYPDHPISKLDLQTISLPLRHPKTKSIDEYYEEGYIKKVWFENKKESLFSFFKTKLLYIPFLNRINVIIKRVR